MRRNCRVYRAQNIWAEIEVEDTATAVVEFESSVGQEVTTAARPDDYEASLHWYEKGLAQIGGIAVNELQTYTPDPSV